MAHAHGARGYDGVSLQIVHRDVNPSNVLVANEGTVKLTDFGVVHMRDRLQGSTAPGMVKGKLAYLAPEYISGDKASSRVDLYGAGVMLFELLSGESCFGGGPNALEVMGKIVNDGLPFERLASVQTPDSLQHICELATAKDPNDRFSSAGEMAAAIEAWMIQTGHYASSGTLAGHLKQHGYLPD